MIIELIPKYQRILNLYKLGFNIPHSLYINPAKSFDSQEVIDFIEEHNSDWINIRTYTRTLNQEGWNRAHYTEICKDVAVVRVKLLHYGGIQQIIDTETPNNGIWAGSILINFETYNFIIDYVHKPEGRAMVREVDSYKEGNLYDTFSLTQIASPLRYIVRKSFKYFTLPCKSVILEWSLTTQPSGKNQSYEVWWEYRNMEN